MVEITTPQLGFDPTQLVNGTGTSLDEGNEFLLGTIVIGVDGDEWIYCHAQEILTANNAVFIHETFEVENVDVTITGGGFGHLCGVCETTCADNDFLWIKISGETNLNVATSSAANTALNSTASVGRLDDNLLSGSEVINNIVQTAAESSNVAVAYLRRPSVGATLT